MVEFTPKLQYTETTFANPVRVIFQRLYSPDLLYILVVVVVAYFIAAR